jgi:hypothetical protein
MASDYWFKGWELGFENKKLQFKVKTTAYSYAFVVQYPTDIELNKFYHFGA